MALVVRERIFAVGRAVVVAVPVDDVVDAVLVGVAGRLLAVGDTVVVAVGVEEVGDAVTVGVAVDLVLVRQPVVVLVAGHRQGHVDAEAGAGGAGALVAFVEGGDGPGAALDGDVHVLVAAVGVGDHVVVDGVAGGVLIAHQDVLAGARRRGA